MKLRNNDIRMYAKKQGVRLWQVADALGMLETALSRKLRYELSVKEKELIKTVIDKLAEYNQEENDGFEIQGLDRG